MQKLRLLRSELLVAAPTSFVVVEALCEGGSLDGWARGAASLRWGAAGMLALAALVVARVPLAGRLLASLAALLVGSAGAFVVLRSPALALTAMLGLIAAVAWLWHEGLPTARVDEEDEPSSAGVAPECGMALLSWLLVGPAAAATSDAARVAAVVAIAASMILGAGRVLRGWSLRGRLAASVLLALPPLLTLAAALTGGLSPGHSLNVLAVGPALLSLWAWSRGGAQSEPSWWSAVLEHPARLLVVTFVSLAGLGAALLGLPASATGAEPVSALDAVFTAVSAVCVTGLVVLDTPTVWSGFGQGVLCALIQLGGLGIMTFYAAAVPLLGRRLSMRHERAIAGALSIDDRGHLYGALRRVLGVTFGCELAGALLLFGAFRAEGLLRGEALWKAAFTAISAFCNAGFALDGDSLVSYQAHPLVLHVVAALIVAGGLSPLAVVALPRAMARRRRVMSLELKLIYVVSGVLLLSGALIFAAFEWEASLAALPWRDKLHNAWFQSVTLRTAGFNSVDLEGTRFATQAVMVFMMFVGGSPGGTAGGIKTTTLAALCLAVVAALQGRSDIVLFGRRLQHTSVYKAAAITTMGVLSVVVVLVALLLSHPIAPHAAVFEVVSALGTVGLSLGATSQLDEIGKVLVAACMLAGRIGPLTLFVILVERRSDSAWTFPAEDLRVG